MLLSSSVDLFKTRPSFVLLGGRCCRLGLIMVGSVGFIFFGRWEDVQKPVFRLGVLWRVSELGVC